MLQNLVPMLYTGNIQQTIDFYTNTLGFSLDKTNQQEKQISWCSLSSNSVSVMFTTLEALAGSSDARMTGSLYVHTNDVDGLWKKHNENCEIVYPIEDFSYGMREFGIRDNNGYLLAFGQPVKPQTEYQKFFPSSFTLETPRVLLRLMNEEDIDLYNSLATSKDTWKYFTKDLSDPNEMKNWIDEALRDRMEEKRMPFTVIDKDTNEICGSTSYGNISFYDRRVEIGWSWLGPQFLGSGVNRHAKFALLSFAFEVMKMQRVEIKTDNQNDRAKAALIKVGMKPEGVLRNHMQMHSDRRRDTIYFSIIASEWEERKASFFSELA
jgi:RimJ/RimL family protein N-acetyltransferase